MGTSDTSVERNARFEETGEASHGFALTWPGDSRIAAQCSEGYGQTWTRGAWIAQSKWQREQTLLVRVPSLDYQLKMTASNLRPACPSEKELNPPRRKRSGFDQRNAV